MRLKFWNKPRLSIVLVVYRMPAQALKTLFSLSPGYQQGVSEDAYEVIVVENESDQLLGEKQTLECGRPFRYFEQPNDSRSPVAALNFGVAQARGPMVALMIDGARMATPGVVRYTLMAGCMAQQPLICMPGYHLGEKLQQEAVNTGYNEQTEAALLAGINWPQDGYRLFEISCLSGTGANGFFKPIAESNYLAMPKTFYHALGGFDPAFDLPGGGFANLDFYKRCCEHPDATLFILLGEGSFHQFHGGVTTGLSRNRLQETLLPKFSEQYRTLRGAAFSPPQKRAVYLGMIPDSAQKFIKFSAEKVLQAHGG